MDKIFFYMHQNTSAVVVMQVEHATGISRGDFSLEYLDCPLSHSKRKKEHYYELIEKIKNKLQK